MDRVAVEIIGEEDKSECDVLRWQFQHINLRTGRFGLYFKSSGLKGNGSNEKSAKVHL